MRAHLLPRVLLAFPLLLTLSSAASAAGPVVEEVETPTLSATVFSPPSPGKHAALLVLGGAEGGRGWAKEVGGSLAAEGYVVLAESYFRGPGLPAQLLKIPIERLQAGIDELVSRPDVDPGRIGLVGISKGAEAALLLASLDPRVRAVVAASPSDVVWQGIDRSGGANASSWTRKGAPLPYVSFASCAECRGLLDLYVSSRKVAQADGSIESRGISIENIRAPVLLIGSDQDAVWPSADMSKALLERSNRHKVASLPEILIYSSAGHFAFGPPSASTKALEEDVDWGGGDIKALQQARRDAWTSVVTFLKKSLPPVSR